MQTIIQTEETERSRFAKDLHDGLGPLLSAMGIYLNAFAMESSDKRKKFALENMERTIDEAILSIKEISNNISPHILQNFGLDEAIKSFLDRFMHVNEVRFIYENDISKRLDQMLEISIYRIVAELVTNSMKHAKAKNIKIKIKMDQEIIRINYKDDGIGFNIEETNKKTRGMGLFSIKNRVTSLNGKIHFDSKINDGIKIDIEFNCRFNKEKGIINLKY